MPHEEIARVYNRSSARVHLGGVVVSAPEIKEHEGKVRLVVGRPGFPNVMRTLETGGAILFETPDDGVIEVRVLRFANDMYSGDYVQVLACRIPGRAGIAGGFVEEAGGNTPFEPHERARIAEGFKEVRDAVADRQDLRPEQIDFVIRKLDEIVLAATRFGRRDWINLMVGTLTSTIVSAALGSDVGRFLFRAVGDALSWLFSGPVHFLK